MADISALTSILSSVKAATEIAKLLKDSDLSLEKAEMKLKLADLISALADAKIEITDIQELVAEKDRIIKELEDRIDIRKTVKWEAPYYFVEKDNKKDGPFCQLCYDKEERLIRLQSGRTGSWSCHSCEKVFRDDSYVPPQRKTISKGKNWVKDY